LSQNEFLYALIFLTETSVRGALLGSIPVAIICSFFVEHYVAGLTSGSVKG
jgi:multiple sugar transport system permease protein